MAVTEVDVDLGPISLHEARVTRHAVRIAMRSGELALRENYEAAVRVDAWLSLRIAQAERASLEPQT